MTAVRQWGYWDGTDNIRSCTPDDTPGFVHMHETTALGLSLVTNGALGVDLITLKKGESFSPHTHPGHHILIVVRGRGTITIERRVVMTQAGQVYLVPGGVPHAVGTITDHALLAVGSPHRAVDDPGRAVLVEYAAVATSFGALQCFACDYVNGVERQPGECSHIPAEWATAK